MSAYKKKTFTSRKGEVNEKVKQWLDKHPDIVITSLSGNNLKVEVLYTRKQ